MKDPDARDERRVIYVYTADWADEAEVMSIREKLRGIGIVDRIGYKRNIETYRGEYSSKGKKSNLLFCLIYQAFRSLFFGRRFLYPHFLHAVARTGFLALQCMHIFTLSNRASASGNFPIIKTPRKYLSYKECVKIT